ncbi:MAG TPA: diguanylate cyclase [Anaerolineales bacterium]|jgi:two-component system chemotaxis response regulator CheY|nr:diguanylate cyclase [Anaerolineales bacterium]
MKILVLDRDLNERVIIQQVVQQSGHEIVSAENSEAAMQLLQEGDIRFVIADRVTTDMDEKNFVKSVRDAKPPYPIFILVLTAKAHEPESGNLPDRADDSLSKPIVPAELRSRVRLGERILGLGDHLASAKDTLERIAMFDTLTSTLNQQAFLRFSSAELERARRGQTPLSLIALDIDGFQAINDKYGENVGNDVLSLIAQAIREKSRPYDGVGRYNGDTFLIILPGVIGQDAEKIAERIIKGILNTNITLLDGREIKVGLSAGVVSTLRISVSTEIEMLIQHAMEAVAHAKREGGNQSHMVFI